MAQSRLCVLRIAIDNKIMDYNLIISFSILLFVLRRCCCCLTQAAFFSISIFTGAICYLVVLKSGLVYSVPPAVYVLST